MSPKTKYANTQPTIGIIEKVEYECEDTQTFYIKLPYTISDVRAGQFIMLWIPGVDEFPIGVAGYKNNILELGISEVGEGTKALFALSEGAKVGIRGFYGKPFAPPKNVQHFIVGGGFGMTPLKLLITQLLERNTDEKILVFEGARTKNRLLYYNWLIDLEKKGKIKLYLCTDDGTVGYHGFPTVLIEEKLKEITEPVVIYAAGPEKMMKAVYEIGTKYPHVVDMQMSLADRYMRCGFGLCSACAVDPTGWRICVDGPVFNKEQLAQIEDFGKYNRTATGEKNKI